MKLSTIHPALPEGLFTKPLASFINDPADFDQAQMNELVKKLAHHIKVSTSFELEEGNLYYWLTYTLHWAVKHRNNDIMHDLGQVLLNLTESHSSSLIAMLQKIIPIDPFFGQTAGYAWFDELYSATFNPLNDAVLVYMSFIFSRLIKQQSQPFVGVIIRPMSEGPEMGKHALLLLSCALYQTTVEIENQENETLLASLLAQCIVPCLEKNTHEITQEIQEGHFEGKSVLYFLFSSLEKLSSKNIEAVRVLCELMTMMIESNAEAFINELTRAIDFGAFTGLNNIHIMILGLKRAAYTSLNQVTVNELTRILKLAYLHSATELNGVLSLPINTEDYKHENGVMMFVKALVKAAKNHLDIQSMSELLSMWIQSGSSEILNAFSTLPTGNNEDATHSPLCLFIGAIKGEAMDGTNYRNMMTTLRYLASTPTAIDLFFSLPSEERSIFLNAFNNKDLLSAPEKARLIRISQEQLFALPEGDLQKDRLLAAITPSSQVSASHNKGMGFSS